jgi:hypothetical protein
MIDAPQETAAEKKRREQFEAEQDVRTLVEARQIAKDEARLNRAKALMEDGLKAAKK